MNKDALRKQLVRHEDLKLKPYRDSVGKLTIGIGRNLDDVGISEAEAYLLFENDVTKVERELNRIPWYQALDPVRQTVIANMAFNMGVPTLLTFKHTIESIESGNYEEAADRMLQSKWAMQVGRRAIELANIMKSGIL